MQEIKEGSPRFDAMHSIGTHGDFYALRNMEQPGENSCGMDFGILRRLKQDYPTKVVVASIMGQTEEQWMERTRHRHQVCRLSPQPPGMPCGGHRADETNQQEALRKTVDFSLQIVQETAGMTAVHLHVMKQERDRQRCLEQPFAIPAPC